MVGLNSGFPYSSATAERRYLDNDGQCSDGEKEQYLFHDPSLKITSCCTERRAVRAGASRINNAACVMANHVRVNPRFGRSVRKQDEGHQGTDMKGVR